MVSIPHQPDRFHETLAAVSMVRFQLDKLEDAIEAITPEWVHATRGEVEDRKPWAMLVNRINDAMNLITPLENHLCELMAEGLTLDSPPSKQRAGDSEPNLRFRGRMR